VQVDVTVSGDHRVPDRCVLRRCVRCRRLL
jgi:hypothetical protein